MALLVVELKTFCVCEWKFQQNWSRNEPAFVFGIDRFQFIQVKLILTNISYTGTLFKVFVLTQFFVCTVVVFVSRLSPFGRKSLLTHLLSCHIFVHVPIQVLDFHYIAVFLVSNGLRCEWRGGGEGSSSFCWY